VISPSDFRLFRSRRSGVKASATPEAVINPATEGKSSGSPRWGGRSEIDLGPAKFWRGGARGFRARGPSAPVTARSGRTVLTRLF